MKIIVTGTRGIPNIQGGVETHCEELYPRLVELGLDITIVRRTCFINDSPPLAGYKGVKFKDLSSPKVKGLEAAVHTLKSVLYAYRQKADIVHIHAIGPSITVPLAKLLGLKVVVTHHGPDYDRANWGRLAKFILKTGERFAAKWADKIIVISTVINDILKNKYHRYDGTLIYNGVNTNKPIKTTQYISSLGLESGQYILAVGRFVEEKGFDKLINAFKLQSSNYKLVIAGDADHETNYSVALKKLAIENNVILTGIIKGDKLKELYSHAGLFVLPSSHEGLPITLLEAMSYNINVLVSNIPANLAVELPDEYYFDLNNIEDLKNKLSQKVNSSKLLRPTYNLDKYNWENIAKQTFDLYLSLQKNHT